MSVLRYLSFNTYFFDLGIFDHTVYQILKGNFAPVFWGHFMPVLLFFAPIYMIVPSAVVLLVVQTLIISLGAYPIFGLARKYLGSERLALVVVCIYFLYPPVEYNNLFDFHTDHMFVTSMLFFFYFLERGSRVGVILTVVFSMLIKEIFLLQLSFLGIYMILVKKKWRTGTALTIVPLMLFLLHVEWIVPFFSKGQGRPLGGYAHLGSGVFDVVLQILSHPLSAIELIFEQKKLEYLFLIFSPLLFVPLLSPLELVPTVPGLGASLLSKLENYYWIGHQYTCTVTPFLFVSLIYALKTIEKKHRFKRTLQKIIRRDLGNHDSIQVIVFSIFIVTVFCNVAISPSPLSLAFWKRGYYPHYYRDNYIITGRDRLLRQAIEKVPAEASVSVQNPINSSRLAHRDGFHPFPNFLEESDFVLLDTRRAHFVGDRVDEAAFRAKLQWLLENRRTVYEADGIYLFRK